MSSKLDGNDFGDLNAIVDIIAGSVHFRRNSDLIVALNSRGPLVHAGRVKIQDVMNAASNSIAACGNTTQSNPGPLVHGVSERRFQETLMQVLAAFEEK